MEKLLYPERKRCRKCRSYFGFEIIERLYCSYECAGKPRPDRSDPSSAPRECALPAYKGGGFKRSYELLEEAEEVAARSREQGRPLSEAYQCSYCLYFHVGNRRLTDEEWEAEQERREEVRRNKVARRAARVAARGR